MKMPCIATVLALGLCSSASALTYMGPPTTTMKQGQWAIGERGGWSENDVEIGGVTLEDVELTNILGSVHVGLATSRMELFGLFGVGNVEDTGYEFAAGVGTKITMNSDRPLSWGLLAQGVFYQQDEPFILPPYSGNIELEAWEIQIAAGPCWRFNNFSIYGGPFLHLIQGDNDVVVDDTVVESLDVEQHGLWGGYVGLGLHLDRVEVTGEIQVGPDAWGLGLGVTLKL